MLDVFMFSTGGAEDSQQDQRLNTLGQEIQSFLASLEILSLKILLVLLVLPGDWGWWGQQSFQGVCKAFIKAHMIHSVQPAVTWALETLEGVPKREAHSLTVSLPTWGRSALRQGKASPHLENTHTMTRTCWLTILSGRWIKSGWRVLWSPQKRSEASENKNSSSQDYGSGRSGIAGRRFLQFVEGSPPMAIHNLHHLKCTMVGEGMQNPKYGICQGAGKKQVAILDFPHPGWLLNWQPLFTYLNFSDPGAERCHVTGHQEGKSLAMRGNFFQKQNRLHPHMPPSW